MCAEEMKPPESPWKDGDENERKAGPEWVERLRESRTRAYRERVRPISKEEQKQIDSAKFKDFRQDLIDTGGKYEKTYKVNVGGHIEGVYGETEPEIDLLYCSSPDATFDRIVSTPEALRATAKHITDAYPEIDIVFQESLTRDKISYTATLKEGHE